VVVEFCSYIKGQASFKILRPSGFPNTRIKIDKHHETSPLAVIGKALEYLNDAPVHNYQKWNIEYLKDIGEWADTECVVTIESQESPLVEEPKATEPVEPELSEADKRKFVTFWWKEDGRYIETATPPESDLKWEWDSVIKQWVLTRESHLKYIEEGW